jgi:Holliday junction resolvase-like predicted endonuclease
MQFTRGGHMSVERNLLISLLRLTKNGVIEQKNVNKDARLPASVASTILNKLQTKKLLHFKDALIQVDTESRLKLAVKVIELGADIQCISDFLKWQEFEYMAALALEPNGYAAKRNVRFKGSGRRWEIDVVGCRKPLVVCIDCKHWHHGMHASTLNGVASAQTERVAAFADSLPSTALELPCAKWTKAKFVPVILSLIPFGSKFSDNVPIVPVFQLQDFINQLPMNVESLKYFSREFSHL